MYNVVVTELAEQDLDSIVSYIAIQLHNPTAAGRFLDEVEKCYAVLRNEPLLYENRMMCGWPPRATAGRLSAIT